MDTPKTSSGKACKLCSKKGSHCHHHSSSPKTKAVNDIDELLGTFYSPGKTPKRNFENLDPDIIWKLLLGFSREQMVALCKLKNPKIRRICSNKEFQRQYDELNPKNFIKGKLIETWHSDSSYEFKDERGNTILLQYYKDRNIFIVTGIRYIIPKFKSTLTLTSVFMLTERNKEIQDSDLIYNILNSINRTNWIKKGVLDQTKKLEFLKDVEEKVIKADPKFNFKTYPQTHSW